MNAAFDLDYADLPAGDNGAAFAQALSAHTRIDSAEGFNGFCRTACRLWEQQASHEITPPATQFHTLLEQIAQGGESVIPTAWGGVVITRHETPQVDKFLVVRRGTYLALEKHAQKVEHLEVREGRGLLLFRRTAAPILTVRVIAPGDQFHFAPGTEHCLIGLEPLLVFEQGTDPKGMDQDLIFLYTPALS